MKMNILALDSKCEYVTTFVHFRHDRQSFGDQPQGNKDSACELLTSVIIQ